MVSAEGDPDYPVSQGALCAKGAAFLSMHYNEHRLQKPLYRAPGSDRWEEKDWDFVLDRIAHRVKETRDSDFLPKNKDGQQVNRVESIFQLGTSQMDNEECGPVPSDAQGAWGSVWITRPGSDTAPLFPMAGLSNPFGVRRTRTRAPASDNPYANI